MVNSTAGFNINRQNYQTSSRQSTLILDRTNEKHLQGTGDAERLAIEQKNTQSFGDLLISQVDQTSQLETKAETLATQFITNPDSVNEHDVTIAATQASLAINIMTNIVTRALESYRAIMSLQ